MKSIESLLKKEKNFINKYTHGILEKYKYTFNKYDDLEKILFENKHQTLYTFYSLNILLLK